MNCCRGTRKDGELCRVTFNLSPDGFCLNHDPLRVDAARAAQAKAKQRGGASSSSGKALRFADRADLPTPHAPKSLDEVKLWASWLALELVIGGIDAAVAREANKALQTLAQELRWESDLVKQLRELRKGQSKGGTARAG